MPPKIRTGREQILCVAFSICRTEGIGAVNARDLSQMLGCSTQPILYHFDTMEELRRALYEKAKGYYLAYLGRISREEDPILGRCLRLLEFAAGEPNIFLFLSQGLPQVEGALPCDIGPIWQIGNIDGVQEPEQKEALIRLSLFVHGYAMLLSRRQLPYDPQQLRHRLGSIYNPT